MAQTNTNKQTPRPPLVLRPLSLAERAELRAELYRERKRHAERLERAIVVAFLLLQLLSVLAYILWRSVA